MRRRWRPSCSVAYGTTDALKRTTPPGCYYSASRGASVDLIDWSHRFRREPAIPVFRPRLAALELLGHSPKLALGRKNARCGQSMRLVSLLRLWFGRLLCPAYECHTCRRFVRRKSSHNLRRGLITGLVA